MALSTLRCAATQFNFTDTVTYYQVPPNSESCESYSQNLVVQLSQVSFHMSHAVLRAMWLVEIGELPKACRGALVAVLT